MSPMDFSQYLPSSRISLAVSAGFASVAAFVAYQSYNRSIKRARAKAVVRSPLTSLLPKLSETEKKDSAYPTDILPGARDVDSPYGNVRVYEFGPEKGRKVLLIHGVSTPCVSLAAVAQKLADRGCRVMLFDLFGRGYSDTPLTVDHDIRLYTTQILIALSSSPISGWTGPDAFSLIGYSLGGGIGASFTSYFPMLVKSLILIAPAGIIRPYHIASSSRILYQTEGILPEFVTNYLVFRRLNHNPTPLSHGKKPLPSSHATQNAATVTKASGPSGLVAPEDAVKAEISSTPAVGDPAPLFPTKPLVTVAGAVQWQIDHHKGFIPSFISSIRYAPVTHEHDRWKLIGQRLSAQKANSANEQAQLMGLERNKVLIIFGKLDPVIVAKEVEEDAEECFGKGNVEFVEVEAGHEVPVTKSREVVDAVWKFWGEEIPAKEAGFEDFDSQTG